MIKIYHNNRCSKSRSGLEILKKSGKEFEVIHYMETPVSESGLQEIIKLLGIRPEELVRKNEAVWKALYKGKSLSDKELIQAMAKHPKLIQRPIVIHGEKGIIGRPPERILSIL